MISLGPNEVSFVDADLIPKIMGPDGMPKGPSKFLLCDCSSKLCSNTFQCLTARECLVHLKT